MTLTENAYNKLSTNNPPNPVHTQFFSPR